MYSTELSKMNVNDPVFFAFHRCLNSAGVVPPKAYRRNSTLYPLVCYINNLIGVLLSENFELVPLFVARAAEHMADTPASEETVSYYSLVSSYLAHVTYHVKSSGFLAKLDADRIPETILSAGPQQAPNPSFQGTRRDEAASRP